MPYYEYLKRRAIVHRDRGLTALAIMDALAEEGLQATRQGIAKFLKWYAKTHSFARALGTTSVPRPHRERTSTAPRAYLDRTTSIPRPHHECTSTAPREYLDRTTGVPRSYVEHNTSVPRPHREVSSTCVVVKTSVVRGACPDLQYSSVSG